MYHNTLNILKNGSVSDKQILLESLLSKAVNEGLSEAEIVFMETCKKMLFDKKIIEMSATLTGVSDVGV